MSGSSQKRRFLSPRRISELVWDSESEDAAASSDSTSDDEGDFQNEPGVSHLQPDRPTSSGQASSSYFSTSASDGFQSGSGQQWARPSGPQTGVAHTFTGGPRGKRNSEVPHLDDSSSPLSVFLLYFAEIITLLVLETNRYFHDHLDRYDEGPTPPSDVTEAEMLVFLAITIQMGHCIRDKLTDYWSRAENFYTSFYSNAMKRDRFFHILRFLHFTDNKNEPDMTDENSDRLWKMRHLFDILNEKFSKFYSPSEHLAVDEVIVKYKGRVIFRQYIPKKHKRFGIKIYKLCDETGYTYNMTVYLGRDRQRTAQHLTATHATVSQLTEKIQGRGHKLYMDNYFSSPDLFNDLATKQIYCCGTVRPNRKGMPQDFGPKRMTLKRGDLQVRTRGDLTTILWKDKRDVRILTNIHDPPAEGNFCDSNGKAIKPQIVADYNRHMGYVDKGDRMANSYSINRRTWKWTKKLFFHLFDLTILNSHILYSSLGGKKISHRDFRNTLMWNLLAQAGHERNVRRPIGRPPAAVTQVLRLEERDRQHWPIPSATRRRCRVCSAKGVTRNVSMICKKCDVALCCDTTCFSDYHTKTNL